MSTRPTIEDLTAQAEAVDAAFAEGAELPTTDAPDPIATLVGLLQPVAGHHQS